MTNELRPRRPYVWTRAYSYEQFQKIEEVGRMRRDPRPAIGQATKFARCQIRDVNKWYRIIHSFEGYWNGEPVSFDPCIRPLFMEYATRLYETAAQEALQRFPGFTDHHVEDGPDLGERRLVFTSSKHELAVPFLFNRMRTLAEDKAVSVAESVHAELDGSTRIGGRRRMKLFVTVDRPSTDKGVWDEVRACFTEGRPFPIDPTPRQCDWRLVAPMRVALSLPELVYLNWADVRTPLSAADRALLESVATFDPAVIAQCIANGADPNATHSGGETALMELITSNPGDTVQPEPGEDWESLEARIPPVSLERRKACIQVLLDAGAHLDVRGPDENTALDLAILRKDEELLEWLLSLGADDTIQYDNTYPAAWPTTWDWAAGDCSIASTPEEVDLAERTWRMLRKHRQAPDGTMPDERPDW